MTLTARFTRHLPRATLTSMSKPRRTQEERSSETRSRILNAAIEVLFEKGYVGATTTEIAKRAGVSRGAQLPHFPTRRDLVTVTVQHLIHRRSDEFREAVGKLPEADRYPAAIDLLWEFISGSTFYAWLEVVVAARTDPELAVRVAELTTEMRETTRKNFDDLFPELAATPQFSVIPEFVMSLLEGLALRRVAGCGEDATQQVLVALKLLGGMLDSLQL